MNKKSVILLWVLGGVVAWGVLRRTRILAEPYRGDYEIDWSMLDMGIPKETSHIASYK